MTCIKIFPYSEATEWSKQIIFANSPEAEEDMMDFEEWDYEVYDYWIVTTANDWAFDESLEEVIIRAVDDILGLPFDESDYDLLYGFEEVLS